MEEGKKGVKFIKIYHLLRNTHAGLTNGSTVKNTKYSYRRPELGPQESHQLVHTRL